MSFREWWGYVRQDGPAVAVAVLGTMLALAGLAGVFGCSVDDPCAPFENSEVSTAATSPTTTSAIILTTTLMLPPIGCEGGEGPAGTTEITSTSSSTGDGSSSTTEAIGTTPLGQPCLQPAGGFVWSEGDPCAEGLACLNWNDCGVGVCTDLCSGNDLCPILDGNPGDCLQMTMSTGFYGCVYYCSDTLPCPTSQGQQWVCNDGLCETPLVTCP